MQNSAAIKLESANQQAARPQVTKGEAAFGHRLPSGHLICDLCPRFCELAPGQRGWCQTRYNRRGRLWAANYNWLSILQFGRIESVPLVEYANGGVVLKVGSFGCNFKPQAEREHFGASPQFYAAGFGQHLPQPGEARLHWRGLSFCRTVDVV